MRNETKIKRIVQTVDRSCHSEMVSVSQKSQNIYADGILNPS